MHPSVSPHDRIKTFSRHFDQLQKHKTHRISRADLKELTRIITCKEHGQKYRFGLVRIHAD